MLLNLSLFLLSSAGSSQGISDFVTTFFVFALIVSARVMMVSEATKGSKVVEFYTYMKGNVMDFVVVESDAFTVSDRGSHRYLCRARKPPRDLLLFLILLTL